MADRNRRMSLRMFRHRSDDSPPDVSSIPSVPPSPVEKRTEPFNSASPDGSENSSPKIRPRTLQKNGRTSVFGSLRSLQSLDEDEKAKLTRSDSKASSLHEDELLSTKNLFGERITRHGEVQSAGSTMFRKRSHYLVLTESYLIRFKNQTRAAETFPVLGIPVNRGPLARSSTSSAGSFHDLQMTISNDSTQFAPLEQIVAVYRLDDGRPFFTIEVSWLDEQAKRASAMQLQFHEPQEAESWTIAIRIASSKAKRQSGPVLHNHTLEHIARVLDRDRDYDPLHFYVFKAVQLPNPRSTSRYSSDDPSKSNTHVCYLVIGLNKLHLIPIPRLSTRSSTTSLTDLDTPTSFGITTLAVVKLQQGVESFQLHFKFPFKNTYTASLASCHASDIVLWLRYASEYLRPEWRVQPFVFDVPSDLDDQMDQPNFPLEDHNCFDRTLVAYCAAYDVDPSRITYTVDYDCEDAPCFRLLPSGEPIAYNNLELLAVLRALRYNESFTTISFADIDLRPIRDIYDLSSDDLDGTCTRSGTATQLVGCEDLPILLKEVRALALKSRRLRRLDFTNAVSPSTGPSSERRNTGIPEALAPLCKKSLTNVDHIVLNGNLLGDSDLDHLVDAASEKRCHFRALEIGNCGLSVHDVDVLLSTLAVHENTMEVINISNAQGRFSPELFQRGIGAFSRIRKLNLNRVQKTAGPEPLIAPEILLSWRLEYLDLSQTSLNEQSIDGIAAYLASSKSDTLRELNLHQCGLTGKNLAVFLQAMTREQGIARNIHVNAGDNRLGVGCSTLSKVLANNFGPVSISMRTMDFEKERHFRDLIVSLTKNTVIRKLDISRASLPYEASQETSEALKEMFATNQTLEELDISGEHAHLDAARFGIGLNHALLGLERNTVLKLLQIEHQSLGLQGANTLAGMLEKNQALLEIHCEHNDINLQSFTVLVDSLRKNKTLLYMPLLESDRAKSMDKVKEEFDGVDHNDEFRTRSPKPGAIKKGISALSHHKASRSLHHRKTSSMASNSSFTDQDVAAVINALDEKWQHQRTRMQKYLQRNYQIATGTLPVDSTLDAEDNRRLSATDGRPSTSDSLSRILARVKMDRTPTVEKPALLEPFDEKLVQRNSVIFSLPEN